MKNKYILISILFLFSLTISGCWDSVEIDNRELVYGIGVDKVNGKILLSCQSVLPQNISNPMKTIPSQVSSVRVISSTGNSISSALKAYRHQINKSVYLQDNRILVIGEAAAKKGLTSILDFFLRYDESRPRALILVCKGKASDIVRWSNKEFNIPSAYIVELVTSPNKLSPVLNVDMHKLSLKLFSKTTSPVITQVKIVTKGNAPPRIKYAGAGVFDKDKLVGWLDVDKTDALLRITNQANRGNIEAPFPGKKNKIITQRVIRFRTKITPRLSNGNVIISLNVTEEGNLIEDAANKDINSPQAIKALEKSLNMKIKKDFEDCLRKVQKKYKTDVFGFGDAVHKKFPKQWKQLERRWKKLYPNIKVTIKVNAKIRGTGAVIDSFKK